MDNEVENIREARAEALLEAAEFFQGAQSDIVSRILIEFASRAEKGLDLFVE